MGVYLQALEALHGAMTDALLGITRPEPLEWLPAPTKAVTVVPPASTAPAATAPDEAGCNVCGDKLYSLGFCRRHYQSDYAKRKAASNGTLHQVKPVQVPMACTSCGKGLSLDNVTGLCRSCAARRNIAARNEAPAANHCTHCGGTLRGDNQSGICSECRKKGKGSGSTERETAFVEGDHVRITSTKCPHPFARGDVARVMGIERQATATWYRLGAGTGIWHNFREDDLELHAAKDAAA
jgi:Zn finger protein HypA/HybF involved in hydrogenase expression